ncbi:MAG: hypothetical protein AUK55_15005 [Syntrophobacteraceae bacterium CG2_30_61_12]|nr:MAG: hypothetical protein AUK55_15005 [Syntrophobacteraceae bacterium CG2_30_61_12]PIU30847.1 MAG: DNA-directed RNA polymerase subunit omega [Syntrophobacteraceae bacterium CG07_land_8_20_14_0_80_61_8]
MARVTVEDCLDRVNSRFALVHLAVRRVLQMRKGYPVFIEAPKNKEVVRALREISAGYVTIDNIRELEGAPEPLEEPKLEAPTVALAELEESASDTDEIHDDIATEDADDSIEKNTDPA